MSFQNIDLQWFAAEDEGRTEEPSEYKLRKAREEGRIPKSQDLNSSVVFFVTAREIEADLIAIRRSGMSFFKSK